MRNGPGAVLVPAAHLVGPGTPEQPVDVLVEDGVVTGVGDVGRPPASAVRLPPGGHVLPGLADAHCHLLPGHLTRLPAFGVTFAVDMFSTAAMRARLAHEEAAGGARWVSPGIGATAPGGHPYQLVASGLFPDFPALRDLGPARFLAQCRAEGSTFVKAFLDDGRLGGTPLPTLSGDELRELCVTAHAEGLRVVAHTSGTDLAVEALRAGVDALAHLPVPTSPSTDAELVALAAGRGTVVVTTLVAMDSVRGETHLQDLVTSALGPRIPDGWREHLGRTAGTAPVDPAAVRTLVGHLHEAGVTLLPGTDAAFPGVMPGASLHAELRRLVGCGVPAADVLAAATVGTRAWFGGAPARLRVGAPADLVVLAEDPRADVRATRELRAVVLGRRLLVP